MASVLVVFGGRSAEHEVSCVSASAVTAALEEGGHDVVLVGIDREGGWHHAQPGSSLTVDGPPVSLEIPGGSLHTPEGELDFDVAFPVLHGPYGEDGTIQGMFEILGVPYVGAGVLASAVAMDKEVAKRLFKEAGLPFASSLVVRRGEYDDEPGRVVRDVVEELGTPVFVKPSSLGSSVGVGKAGGEAELKQAIEHAFEFGDKVVVEEAVAGREIEVAVIEGPRTSIPGEIVPKSGWYDYRSKYEDVATELLIPAPLSEPATARVRFLAARAFEVLEVRGLARVDFFYEEEGRGFLVNEVNTMPGFTPRSMFPLLWEATGMSYAALVDELVELATAG